MMKLFGKKNKITAVMDGETPTNDLLGKARARLAKDNPPAVMRKRLVVRIATAAAPLVVVGVLVTVFYTAILPNMAGGCGSATQSDEMSTEYSEYATNSKSSGLSNAIPSVSYSDVEPEIEPECEIKELTTEVGYAFIYYQTSDGAWAGYCMIDEENYMIITAGGSEEDFISVLEGIQKKD